MKPNRLYTPSTQRRRPVRDDCDESPTQEPGSEIFWDANSPSPLTKLAICRRSALKEDNTIQELVKRIPLRPKEEQNVRSSAVPMDMERVQPLAVSARDLRAKKRREARLKAAKAARELQELVDQLRREEEEAALRETVDQNPGSPVLKPAPFPKCSSPLPFGTSRERRASGEDVSGGSDLHGLMEDVKAMADDIFNVSSDSMPSIDENAEQRAQNCRAPSAKRTRPKVGVSSQWLASASQENVIPPSQPTASCSSKTMFSSWPGELCSQPGKKPSSSFAQRQCTAEEIQRKRRLAKQKLLKRNFSKRAAK